MDGNYKRIMVNGWATSKRMHGWLAGKLCHGFMEENGQDVFGASITPGLPQMGYEITNGFTHQRAKRAKYTPFG
jgi:hypothetical protein